MVDAVYVNHVAVKLRVLLSTARDWARVSGSPEIKYDINIVSVGPNVPISSDLDLQE